MMSQLTSQSNSPALANQPIFGGVKHLLDVLEDGITISLIATFDLKTCSVHDQASDVLQRADLQEFDYIPVTEDGSVVGVLIRDEALNAEGAVRSVMHRLHESILISAEASLLSFVAEADQTPYCLVLRRRRIEGIVTLSDLQKLAVRPVLFSLITCVELLLAQWLRQKYPNEQDWLTRLSNGRRKKVEDKYEELSKKDMAIDRITATDFCDKRDAVLKLGAFGSEKNEREKQLDQIEKLRNAVAHAGEYASTSGAAKWVAQTVRSALNIIEFLEESLESESAA